ncbi:MAG: DJ-1/PfpI family protein [Anaerolineaceae bacterium]|nr:DJ-1/PfpI family protein [Anaerolineaceae bacterium]
MKKFIRIVIYALVFILSIVALGTIGYFSTISLTLPKPTNLSIPQSGVGSLQTKSYDPTKPTVAVVLGDNRTEDTDFLIPYQLFSASEAYNVYAVAPERKATSLAGGLEVMPDFSYAELNTLLGKSPDVVVIPAIPNPESADNRPILTWIKQQSDRGSYIFSICVGAEVFAATGLLDGRIATTHWGDIDRIQALYPAVNWARGVRYVDGGTYMTSAGITSGIDAVLHYIAQHNGDAVAKTVAEKMHYPSYAFVDQPQVEQYSATPDLTAVGLINILFHWNHPTAGVLVYDGINELELAATYDTYVATYTTRLMSVSETRQLITTQYGLQIVPRWGFNDVPAMERLIVPGSQAHQLAATEISAWQLNGNSAPVFYLHADDPDKFAFDAPLKDLARQENIPTAVLNAMRLEYRPGTMQTEGSAWPLWLTIRPLLVGLVSLALTILISRRLRRLPMTRISDLTAQTQA